MKKIFILLLIFSYSCKYNNTEPEQPCGCKPPISFTKLIMSGGIKTISTEILLKQIDSKEKAGYTIKSITISDNDKAELQGKKPNFSIKIKKAGTFTVTIIIEKVGFKDVTIEKGEITIKKPTATFQKHVISDGRTTITTNQILGQIQELSGLNYTLKSITIPKNKNDIAKVEKINLNLKIKIFKKGTFRAAIILEKIGFLDVEITGCEFEIL